MGTLGSFLSSTREARGLELRDAAQQTRISINYLKALEREDFTKLPGEVFVKGFLKNYARFLNVPEEEVLKRYAELKPQPLPVTPSITQTEPEHPAATASDRQKTGETPLEPFIWGAGIFIALIIFLFTATPRKHADAPVAEQPAPGAAAPGRTDAPAIAQPSGKPEKLFLEITALEDTWVLVRTDTSPQKKAVLKKGETITWSADERFLLSYGSVGAAKLSLNGRELTVNGPKSAVVRDLSVTASGIAMQKMEAERPKPAKPKPQPPAQPQPVVQPAAPAPEAPAPPPAAPESPMTPPPG